MQMISLTFWAGLTHFTDKKTKATNTQTAEELRFKPSSGSYSVLRSSEEPLGCSFLVPRLYFHFHQPGKCQSAWYTSTNVFWGLWLLKGCICSAALCRELLGGECVRVPESQLSFCLCSMWGDPAGHNGKLFRTWFSKWLPFLFPLRLEDIGHSRGKGRYGTSSGNDVAFSESGGVWGGIIVDNSSNNSCCVMGAHLCARHCASLLSVIYFWTFQPVSLINGGLCTKCPHEL